MDDLGQPTTAGDTGTLVTDGSLILGNGDTDNVTFNAEVNSNVIPNTASTHDLGSAQKPWRKGYFDQIAGRLPHVNTAKYSESSAEKRYVRWDAAGSNAQPGVNNKFVAPTNGQLVQVSIRATAANPTPGNTAIAFHKASDGTEDLNSNATETVTVNMTSGNTTYHASFINSTFNGGDILGISLTPTKGFGNVNITCLWMLDWD